MKSKILIIGCGAQCKYAIDIFLKIARSIEKVLDPMGKKTGTSISNFIIEPYHKKEIINEINKNENRLSVIICLSDNKLKEKIYNELEKTAGFSNAIHPGSTISSSAILGECLIINAGAVVQPYSKIGNGVMIHSGVTIEHDNIIGNFANLAPGVSLSGGVSIGAGTTVYTGATVAPNVKIGSNSIVGAGSLVLHNLPSNVLAYGSPAKIVKELE